MFKRWKAFLAKHQSQPEESGIYRIAVTVLVMFALALTLHQIEWPSYSVVVLLLTPAASYLSHRRRESSNLEIKIFLSFAMVALLLWFFVRLSSSLYDPRIPLAELLIWLQTLHAFDLPAKKDLRYTILVALILIAIAAVLTYSSWFSLALLIFCALFLVVGALDFWSDNRLPGTIESQQASGSTETTSSGYQLDRRWLTRTLLFALPAALTAALIIFVFMPRYRGLQLRSLPMNWDIQFSLAHISSGEIINQNLSGQRNTSGKPQRIEGDSYFGFDAEVNLNARGSLSDRIVLKVRTSDWQYHRAVTFCDYTGGGWRSGLEEPVLKTITEPPFYFSSPHGAKDRLTIYYAEVDLPNVVFVPSNPRMLYFPSSEIYQIGSFPDENQRQFKNTPAVLISPFNLEKGVVYSVLNRTPSIAPSALKDLPDWDADGRRPLSLKSYLDLPDTLPQRVRDLSLKLTEGSRSPWERASKLTAYLQQNYRYNLDVDFYPEDADTVDHFLFEAKEGYCEQFASALCVMSRSVGMPARYVTGYLPGTYNPLSGFYEIRAKDAHAWVEIYVPEVGWMTFDPVPGENATPDLGEPDEDRWLLESFLKYLNVPESLRNQIPTLIRGFVLLALLSLAFSLWNSFRGRSSRKVTRSELEPYLLRAESLTVPRSPGETVKNWARRLEIDCLDELAAIYERTFYRDKVLSTQDHDELNRILGILKQRAERAAKSSEN